jgi:DNA helicase HerA-like ATPase
METINVRKVEFKKFLTPKQLKQRMELSLVASGVAGILPLIYQNTEIASVVGVIGGLLYHRNIKEKLERTRIGYGGKVYFRIGKDEIGRDVEITDFYFHRHMLVVGGTGMGKTSLYRVILRQVLRKRFGVIYINFKAEDEDFFNLYSIAKEEGIAEDLIIVNFAPSARYTLETGTYSPLATLQSPQEIADFFFNLLAPAKGDMEYWQGRGRNLMSAASRTFVYMRDVEKKPASLKLLLDSFEVPNMLRIMKSPDCPEDFRNWIEVYLQDLDPSGRLRNGDMRAFTPEMQNQHGYAIQQWKEALMDISLRYSHIFDTNKPDLDFKDALKSSRLVYIHMPALALPNKTKEALGRLILAGLKTATGVMLGERLFGEVEELRKEKKKEKPKNPFLILIDEHGTAPITGIDDFIRQIRSLGGGSIIADQNWDGIKQTFGDAYLNTLLGNSLTKIIMNVEGSEAVMKYLESRIPKVKTVIPSYKIQDGFLIKGDSANLQEEPLVKMDEITKLGAGEGYVIQKENIIKCKFDFYVPKLPKRIDLFLFNRERFNYEELKKILQETDLKIEETVEQVEIPPQVEEEEEETEGGGLMTLKRFRIQFLEMIEENRSEEEILTFFGDFIENFLSNLEIENTKYVEKTLEDISEKILKYLAKQRGTKFKARGSYFKELLGLYKLRKYVGADNEESRPERVSDR